MLVFISLFCVSNTIPQKFQNLAFQAREKMKTRAAKSDREPIYPRGQYNYTGIEFFLSVNLMGSTSRGIKGFALEKSETRQVIKSAQTFKNNKQNVQNITTGYLAIIPNRKKALSDEAPIKVGDAAFVDPTDKTIFKLKSLIADDGEVQIYNVRSIEQLRAFRNIHMFSANPSKGKDTTNNEEEKGSNENIGVTIGFSKEDPATGLSTCFAGYRYYWEKPETGADAFETGPVDYNFFIFSARAGAYAQIFSSFDLRIEDADFRLEADVELSVMAGLGFSLFPDNSPDDLEIPEYSYPLYALPGKSMYGIKLELGLYAFGRIVFKDIRYKLIELLRYDYRVKFGVKTHLSYTQSDGLQMEKAQPFHEIMDEKQSPDKITEEMLNDMFLEITPSMQIGLKLSAAAAVTEVNTDVGLTIRLFLSYDVPFRFRFNSKSCTFPFLSGNYQNQMNFNFAIEGTLKLLKLIDYEFNYEKPVALYHAQPSGEFCFFDSQKSIDAKFDKNKQYPAYIIEPKTVRLCDDCSQTGDGDLNGFFLNLDYRQNGVNPISKSFPFPFVSLKEKNDLVTLNRVFVVDGVTPTSKLQYSGYEADMFQNDILKNFEQFDIMGFPSKGKELCGDDGASVLSKPGVCIKTFISKAQQVPMNVEIAKPSDSNFISYRSWFGEDVYLGMITHSDGSPYVSKFEDFEIFDDTILNSNQKMKGEIRGNNPVIVTIENVNIGNELVKKLNCEINVCDGNKCETILSKAFENVKVNAGLSNFAPVIQLGRDLDKSNKKLQIKLNYKSGFTNHLITTEIPYKNIYKNNIFSTFQISDTSNNAYSYAVTIDRYFSNYVFDVKKLKTNSNAMIARIVSASTLKNNNWGETQVSVFLQANEIYGTLRFFLNLNNKLYDKIPQAKRPPIACVVKMPGIQPLCQNVHRLDEDEYVIVVEAEKTLFSMKNSIYWNKDLHSVNIPYRRTDDGSTNKRVTAKLYASFTISEDKNPFCSATKPYIGYTTKYLACGCIKKFTEDKNTGMLATVKRVDSFTMSRFDIKDDIVSDKWMIRAVNYTAQDDHPYRFEAYFRDQLVEIPSNQASLVFTARQARDIMATPSHMILFRPDNQIQVTYPDGNTEILKKSQNLGNFYEFNIPSTDDYTFTRICNSGNEAHCKTTLSLSSSKILSNDDVYLVEYSDIGYLIDYDNVITGNKLVNNMNRQVIYNRKQVSYSKSWIGDISSKSISGASKLTIRASQVGNKIQIGAFVTIGGSEENIPFSAEKWMNDIDTFLRALKIIEPDNGYTLDVISMDKTGVLMISGSLYQAGATIEDYSSVVDYPISSSLTCETDYPQFGQVSYHSNKVCFYKTNKNTCPAEVLPLSPSEYSDYLSTADSTVGGTVTIYVGENINLDSFILDNNNYDITFTSENSASISGSCKFLAKGTSLSFSKVDISNLDLKANYYFQFTDALVTINGALKSFTILIEPYPIESSLEGEHFVLKSGCVFGENAFPITIEPVSMTISGNKYTFSTSCHGVSGSLMLDVKKEDKPNQGDKTSQEESKPDSSNISTNNDITPNVNDTYVNISFNETIPDDNDNDNDNTNSGKGKGLSAGGIAGIVIAVLVVVAAAVGIALFIIIKRRSNYKSTDSEVQETNNEEF